MKKSNLIYITAFFLLSATGSCKKALEEKAYDFISPSQLGTSTEEDANIWVNGALNTLNSGSFWQYGAFPKVLELDADDATGPDWGMGDFAAGNFSVFWGMDAMWSGPYSLIERSNMAISQVSKMTTPEAPKNNALGQLHFLRAWSYYLLVRAYGAVPIFQKSITEGENPMQPRVAVDSVYGYIISELKTAEQQLYNNTNANYKAGRISQGAASSLLAKVYLTMASCAVTNAQITVMTGPATKLVNGKVVRIPQPTAMTFTKNGAVAGYEKIDAATYFHLARDKAKEVMDQQHGTYDLFPTYADVWQVGNRNKVEHIWSLQALTGDDVLGNGTSIDYVGQLNDKGQILNGKWYGVRDHWYELFESNDQRITDGVVHRWQDINGYFHYYPGKDSVYIKGRTPEDAAYRAKYGYDTTDSYGADAGHIASLRKFEDVSDRKQIRQDFPFPFLRYADILLTYAEAENEVNGPSENAKAALNKVRARSNASTSTVNAITDKVAFRSFVLEERRRELALEANRRWDLIRWGIYLPVMNAVDIDENNVLKRRQEKHLLYPIPLSEVNANKSIPANNPGW